MATSIDDPTQKDLTEENEEESPVLSQSPKSSMRTTRSKVTGVAQSCISFKCTSKPSSNPPIHFFSFPKDRKRCLQWIRKVQRPELNTKTPEELSENYALCSQHFEDEMFVNPKQRQRLTPDAVPSIFENSELSSPTKSPLRKRRKKRAANSKADDSSSRKIPAYRCSPMDCHTMRVKPGEELRFALQCYINRYDLRSAFILSCVGSVTEAQLRMADSTTTISLTTPHEILSLNGTLSDGGHLHICLSDAEGKVIGGHLLYCIINTTAEIVMGDLPRLEMSREMDESTGYKELVVSDRKGISGYSSGDDESRTPNKRWKKKRVPKSTVKLIDTSNGAPTVLVNNTLLKITDMKS